MSRKRLATALALTALALVVLTPAGRIAAQSLQEVFVVNFPEVQPVRGSVTVDGAVRLSELVAIEDVVVPPVRREDTTRLIEAGTFKTDGFPNVVLSLHGQTKGDIVRAGDVGAILIPEHEKIQQAFQERGQMHFALEVAARSVGGDRAYFASSQPRYQIGFSSYRVLLYNTTDKTVTVDLFAYLTN